MRIATITGTGLRWMAALVLVLWGCVIAEHHMLRTARRERVNVLAELRRMREGQRPIPVSQPLPSIGNARPLAG